MIIWYLFKPFQYLLYHLSSINFSTTICSRILIFQYYRGILTFHLRKNPKALQTTPNEKVSTKEDRVKGKKMDGKVKGRGELPSPPTSSDELPYLIELTPEVSLF